MAMYFVQHGLALAKEADPERALSVDGRKEVERISAHLHGVGLAVRRVYHSGKTRAEQTARILADRISDGRTEAISGMGPNDDVAEFASTLENDSMYVGHLPHMEKLVSYLVIGRENARVVKFANGGVVRVEKDAAGFHIAWYLKPSMCKL